MANGGPTFEPAKGDADERLRVVENWILQHETWADAAKHEIDGDLARSDTALAVERLKVQVRLMLAGQVAFLGAVVAWAVNTWGGGGG